MQTDIFAEIFFSSGPKETTLTENCVWICTIKNISPFPYVVGYLLWLVWPKALVAEGMFAQIAALAATLVIFFGSHDKHG